VLEELAAYGTSRWHAMLPQVRLPRRKPIQPKLTGAEGLALSQDLAQAESISVGLAQASVKPGLERGKQRERAAAIEKCSSGG
jgi:hypothetical protein